MVVTDIALFVKNEVQYNQENQSYCMPVYNVNDGSFWYTVCFSEDTYNKFISDLDNKPRHIFFSGVLEDVPIMQDIVGTVNESRQRINLFNLNVLPSDVYVPQKLVNHLISTVVPYTFIPGPTGIQNPRNFIQVLHLRL